MRIIDRYLLREYLTQFIFCMAGFLVLLIGNFVFEISHFLVDKRASFQLICLLVYYQIPYLLMDVFPAAVLFGVFLSLGRLSKDREMDVLRTSGLSFPGLTYPILIITFFMCLGAFYFNDYVVPLANHRYEQEIRKMIYKDFIPFIQENVFFKGPDERIFYIRRINEEKKEVEGVLIYQVRRDKFPLMIAAASGKIEEQWWHLKDGRYYELDDEGKITAFSSFDEMIEDVGEDLSFFLGESKSTDEMTREELKEHMEILKKSGVSTAPFAVTYHLKVAIPFAGLILALLGLPFSTLVPRNGRTWGLAISLLLIMIYFFATVLFRELGTSEVIQPLWAAWIPNLFFLLLGLILLFKVIK